MRSTILGGPHNKDCRIWGVYIGVLLSRDTTIVGAITIFWTAGQMGLGLRLSSYPLQVKLTPKQNAEDSRHHVEAQVVTNFWP